MRSFCDDDIASAFGNAQLRGQAIPTLAWTDELNVNASDSFFFAVPPLGYGKKMPKHVNGKAGKANKTEAPLSNGVLRWSKYYDDGAIVVTRYRQNANESSLCLFHVVIKQKAAEPEVVSRKLKKQVKIDPDRFKDSKPSFTSVSPTSFEVTPGKREAIKVVGENMTASCGRLVKLVDGKLHEGSAIYLYISNAVDNRQVTGEFNQPNDIVASTYTLYLVIHDSLYKLDNHLIEFRDKLVPNLMAPDFTFSLLEDTDLHFYLSTPPLELHQAIELGNTRCVAQLSTQYGADLPPICAARFNKRKDNPCDSGCEGGCCASVNTWIDLARASGNNCTLLFVLVWVRAALGKCAANILDGLRQHVLAAKRLDSDSMLLALNRNVKAVIPMLKALQQQVQNKKDTEAFRAIASQQVITDFKKLSVASLTSPDRVGWLTKQGGSIKTWRRRWFVLKGKQLIYFKTQTDLEPTGVIELEQNSFVRDEREKDRRRKFMFSLGTSRRVFFIASDTESDLEQWTAAIKLNIEKIACIGSSPGAANSGASPVAATYVSEPTGFSVPDLNTTAVSSVRARMAAAKNCFPYLLDETSKVLEFWQVWTEFVPTLSEVSPGSRLEFQVSISSDMQKVCWRNNGPQHIIIQRMVDFFWNVGAPEVEIDRLNDVGGQISPIIIGTWIDMSAKGGMDGGWCFPVNISTRLALTGCDPGDSLTTLGEWLSRYNITTVISLSRDTGAAPPRQTEIRINLPGSDFNAQLHAALDAFATFGFPAISDEALAVIQLSGANVNGVPLILSVITSSDGFARIGLLIPTPSQQTVLSLCHLSQGAVDSIAQFQAALGCSGPAYAEYQYIAQSFGYSVYKEGFDVVFHYMAGEDVGTQ